MGQVDGAPDRLGRQRNPRRLAAARKESLTMHRIDVTSKLEATWSHFALFLWSLSAEPALDFDVTDAAMWHAEAINR